MYNLIEYHIPEAIKVEVTKVSCNIDEFTTINEFTTTN